MSISDECFDLWTLLRCRAHGGHVSTRTNSCSRTIDTSSSSARPHSGLTAAQAWGGRMDDEAGSDQGGDGRAAAPSMHGISMGLQHRPCSEPDWGCSTVPARNKPRAAAPSMQGTSLGLLRRPCREQAWGCSAVPAGDQPRDAAPSLQGTSPGLQRCPCRGPAQGCSAVPAGDQPRAAAPSLQGTSLGLLRRPCREQAWGCSAVPAGNKIVAAGLWHCHHSEPGWGNSSVRTGSQAEAAAPLVHPISQAGAPFLQGTRLAGQRGRVRSPVVLSVM